jgi:hypothetical protein
VTASGRHGERPASLGRCFPTPEGVAALTAHPEPVEGACHLTKYSRSRSSKPFNVHLAAVREGEALARDELAHDVRDEISPSAAFLRAAGQDDGGAEEVVSVRDRLAGVDAGVEPEAVVACARPSFDRPRTSGRTAFALEEEG